MNAFRSKITKRVISMVLALIMTISMVPVNVVADTKNDSGQNTASATEAPSSSEGSDSTEAPEPSNTPSAEATPVVTATPSPTEVPDVTITVECGNNGTVSLKGAGSAQLTVNGKENKVQNQLKVKWGEKVTLEVKPNEGYGIKSIQIGKEIIKISDKAEFTQEIEAKEDITVKAEFEDLKYTVKVECDKNGTAVLNKGEDNDGVSSEEVAYNGSETVTIMPKFGYTVDKITINDADETEKIKLESVSDTELKFELKDIVEDKRINITFKECDAASKEDISISESDLLRNNGNVYIYGKDAKPVIKTEKQGIKVKYSDSKDGSYEGSYEKKEIEISETKTISEIWLYFDFGWHKVNDISDKQPIKIVIDKEACNISITPEEPVNGVYGQSYIEKNEDDENDHPGIDVGVSVEDIEMSVEGSKNEGIYSGIKSVDYKVVIEPEETQEPEATENPGATQDPAALVEYYKNIPKDRVTESGDVPSAKPTPDPSAEPTSEPEADEIIKTWEGNIIVDPQKNDSSNVYVYVHVTDNAGNESVSKVHLDIDITSPEITVSYDNNECNEIEKEGQEEKEYYFNKTRTATIVIKERTNHFDGAAAIKDGIKITAVDAKRDPVKVPTDPEEGSEEKNNLDIDSMISEWITDEGTESNNNDATHTVTITYSEDANYTFAISYTDKAGNVNSEVQVKEKTKAPYKFTVDKTKPTGKTEIVFMDPDGKESSIISPYEAVEDLVNNTSWTFGSERLMNQKVRVTVNEPIDATSPLRPVTYYKQKDSDKNNILTIVELNQLYSDGKFVESETGTPSEKFVVYARLEDYAGNVNYITSNGIILDDTPADIVITPEAANDNGVYGQSYIEKNEVDENDNPGIDVGVSVEDPEKDGTYSGIKSVDYKVVIEPEATENPGATQDPVALVKYYKSILADKVTDSGDIPYDGTKPTPAPSAEPTYDQLRNTWNGAITVDPSLNDSSNVWVYVHAVDNAGNESVNKVHLDIDVTRPEITVSYDNNKDNNGNGYFNADRTATIVIKERTNHFDGAAAKNTDPEVKDGIKITAVDAKGEAVKELDINSMISEWDTAEGTAANNNDATHTATITYSADANYTFAISYTDKAGNANSEVQVADENKAPYKFTVDKIQPTGTISIDNDEKNTWEKIIEILTFGRYKNSDYTITGTATDVTSPLFPVQYYKTDSTTALTKDDLDKLQNDWQDFGEGFSVSPNERFTVYLKITDYAGNYTYISTNGAIADNTPADIEITPESANENGVYGRSYDKGINVDVSVEDPEKGENGGTYSGIKSVDYKVVIEPEATGNPEATEDPTALVEYYKSIPADKVTESGDVPYDGTKPTPAPSAEPTYDQLRNTWNGTINVDLKNEKNDSSNVWIYVHAVDNAGNESVNKVHLDIDVTSPEITVSYDNNTDNNDNGYFNDVRTATIEIKERTNHFDGAAAKNTDPEVKDGIKITAVDAKGETVKDPTDPKKDLDIDSMISEWDTAEGTAANNNDATHTATITYSADANYTFAISYTDKAGNVNSKVQVKEKTKAPYKFTVDKTQPTGTISIDANKWTELIRMLTFGLYKNSKYDITGTAEDATSLLFPVQYYKTDSTKALTMDDLGKLQNDWQDFGEGFSVSPNERFTVYLKITDYAGNYTYISTNGAIADNTKCNVTIELEEPNKNGVYGQSYDKGINVDVSVEDPENGGTYSGIKSVDYKVVKYADGANPAESVDDYQTIPSNIVTQSGDVPPAKDEPALVPIKEPPTYDQLRNTWNGAITVDPSLNDSSNVYLYVHAVDNAGNESVNKVHLDIDVTSPEITVSYDNNECNEIEKEGQEEKEYYFNKIRTATIVIKERTNHFDGAAAKNTDPKVKDGIKITAVDAKGVAVKDLGINSMISEWETKEGTSSNNNDATHTATITYSADANYTFAISYTDKAGNKNSEVQVADGNKAPYKFTVDQTKPTGTISIDNEKNTWEKIIEILTFGLYKNSKYDITGTAEDATSPFSVQYYKTDSKEAFTEDKLNDLTEDKWQNFDLDNGLPVSPDERFTVYLKITDYAGNYTYISTNGAIADDTPTGITITPEATNENGVYGLSYNGINVNVHVEDPEKGKPDNPDAATYSGIKSVDYKVVKYADGESPAEGVAGYNGIPADKITHGGGLFNYSKTSPKYEDLAYTWDGAIKVDPKKNDSSNVWVYVHAVDNAGNESVNKVHLDIDVTRPEISISYDNNKDNNGNGYFNAERTATIVIKERTNHFDGAAAKNTSASVKDGIKITAVDAKGAAVKNLTINNMISEWTTVEGTQPNNNDALHTVTVRYSADANYTFTVNYTDKAGNENAGVAVNEGTIAPYKFTVDKTAPNGAITAESTEGHQDMWNNLRSKLTFGFWSRKGISITGTSTDVTSPTHIQYHVQISKGAKDETTPLTREQLDAVTDWKDFGKGFNVKKEEQFIVYLKVTDSAGNYTYISTDGLIVDKNAPIYESIAPEILVNPVQSESGLYNDDVKVSIKVTDPLKGGTYSGLKEVSYEVYDRAKSKKEPTQKGVLYSFDKKNPSQSDLKHTWSGKIKVNSKKNNSNDIRIVVYATDNSGNSSKKHTTIKIDTTPPVINVSYDNNSADSEKLFKDDRTATIAISERNFDPDDVKVTITNTDGAIPKLSSWRKTQGTGNKDNTVWSATLKYSQDGDYTFAVDYTDRADNKCKEINYAQGTVAGKEFTIDKVDPVIKVSYDNNASKNGKYYKANRTATIVITEHNFDASRVKVKMTATDDGKTVQVPKISNWSSSGDRHTATIRYTKDALYTFDISLEDMAGRKAANYSKQSFYVDKTKPSLEITGVKNNSANNGDVIPVISYSDTNYDAAKVSITLTGVNRGTIDSLAGSYEDIHNGRVFTFENFEKKKSIDDIYTLSATLTDKAGNKITKSIRFSVNRFGSTYALDDATKEMNGTYTKEPKDVVVTEINADALNNIKIILFKNNNSITLEEGKDYKVEFTGGNGQWYKYTYTIFKENFSEDAVYRLSIHSQDSSGNIAENTLDTKNMEINFGVDKTLPVINVKNLEDGKTYALENLTVQMSAGDNLKLDSLVVYLDEKEYKNWTGEELEKLIEEGSNFTFDVPGTQTSAHNVRIEATDAAKNVFVKEIKNFYVTTNLWVRYYNNKPLFFGSIAGIVVIAAGIIILIVLKRRKKEKKQQEK